MAARERVGLNQKPSVLITTELGGVLTDGTEVTVHTFGRKEKVPWKQFVGEVGKAVMEKNPREVAGEYFAPLTYRLDPDNGYAIVNYFRSRLAYDEAIIQAQAQAEQLKTEAENLYNAALWLDDKRKKEVLSTAEEKRAQAEPFEAAEQSLRDSYPKRGKLHKRVITYKDGQRVVGEEIPITISSEQEMYQYLFSMVYTDELAKKESDKWNYPESQFQRGDKHVLRPLADAEAQRMADWVVRNTPGWSPDFVNVVLPEYQKFSDAIDRFCNNNNFVGRYNMKEFFGVDEIAGVPYTCIDTIDALREAGAITDAEYSWAREHISTNKIQLDIEGLCPVNQGGPLEKRKANKIIPDALDTLRAIKNGLPVPVKTHYTVSPLWAGGRVPQIVNDKGRCPNWVEMEGKIVANWFVQVLMSEGKIDLKTGKLVDGMLFDVLYGISKGSAEAYYIAKHLAQFYPGIKIANLQLELPVGFRDPQSPAHKIGMFTAAGWELLKSKLNSRKYRHRYNPDESKEDTKAKNEAFKRSAFELAGAPISFNRGEIGNVERVLATADKGDHLSFNAVDRATAYLLNPQLKQRADRVKEYLNRAFTGYGIEREVRELGGHIRPEVTYSGIDEEIKNVVEIYRVATGHNNPAEVEYYLDSMDGKGSKRIFTVGMGNTPTSQRRAA